MFGGGLKERLVRKEKMWRDKNARGFHPPEYTPVYVLHFSTVGAAIAQHPSNPDLATKTSSKYFPVESEILHSIKKRSI